MMSTEYSKRSLLKWMTAGAALASSPYSFAKDWPNRPIRIIVGFPPGGGTDIMARLVAQSIMERTGHSVIVDNKAGAAANIAASDVMRAKPDGYTFLAATSTLESVNPFFFNQKIYPEKNLSPVSSIGMSNMYLVVNKNFPASNIEEFIAYARKNPDKLSYASSGAGTPPQFAAELLNNAAGLRAAHIPFKGSSPALQAVLANQCDFVFDPGISFPYVKDGQVKLLAVTGSKRSSFFPNLPTLKEKGLKDTELDIWFGMWAPKNVPKKIIDEFSREIEISLRNDILREKYQAIGASPAYVNSEEFRAILDKETTLLSDLMKNRFTPMNSGDKNES